jgi:tetratricopeptide (TPR) repeat protein
MKTRTALAFASIVAFNSAFAADDIASARKLIEAGHYKRASAMLDRISDKTPEYWVLAARMKLAFGVTADALTLAERAVAADANSAEAHTTLAKAYGQKALKAGMFAQMGLARSAKKEVDRALQLDPKNIDANNFLIDYLINAPGIVGGDKNKAREIATAMIQIDPVEGNLAWARIAQHEKQSADALKFFKTAVQAGPSSYRAHANLANAYTAIEPKDWKAAEDEAKTALRLDPERHGGYTVLAAIYAHDRRWDELEELLARAEKQVPDNLIPYFQAGNQTLNDNSDAARAERYLRKYLSHAPEGLMPSLASTHWRLATALERQGKKPDAITELQRAVSLDPDLEGAKKDLKRLQ